MNPLGIASAARTAARTVPLVLIADDD